MQLLPSIVQLGQACRNRHTTHAWRSSCQFSLAVEHQQPLPPKYNDVSLDCGYRLDVLVEGSMIVSLKAVEMFMPIHEPQLLSYVKLSGWRLGLLITFNVEVLRTGIRRAAVKLHTRSGETVSRLVQSRCAFDRHTRSCSL